MTPLGRAVSVAAALLLPALAGARDEVPTSPLPTFGERVEVRVVDVEVFVTDRDGNPVDDLEADDFDLRVDGRKVEITNFYRQKGDRAGARDVAPAGARPAEPLSPAEAADTPSERRLFLTVLVDHTRLAAANRRRAFDAVEEMIAGRLAPGDLVSVVSYDGSLVFHADFLPDHATIGRILDDSARTAATSGAQELERRQIIGELTRGQSSGFLGRTSTATLVAGPLLARIRGYAADEYGRALTSLGQLERVVATLAGLPGRKALLYVSDGIPNRPGEALYSEYVNRTGGGNPEAEPGLRRFDFNTGYAREVGNYDLLRDVEQLGDAANEAGVTIYALDAESDHAAALRSAASEQGAISSSVSISNENMRQPLELAAGVTGGRRIQASGRLSQGLATLARDFATFYSLGFTPAADWQPGSVHTIDVRARRRRLVVRHRERVRLSGADERAAQATVSTLLYASGDNPLEIRLEPGEAEARSDGNALLPVLVDLPVARLALVPSPEAHSARLTFFVSVRDRSGNPGPVQRIPFHLDIPADMLDDAVGRSAHYSLPLVLRPGDRQVAVGVRDEASGLLSTLRLDLDR